MRGRCRRGNRITSDFRPGDAGKQARRERPVWRRSAVARSGRRGARPSDRRARGTWWARTVLSGRTCPTEASRHGPVQRSAGEYEHSGLQGVSYMLRCLVIEIRETCEYSEWFESLRDRMAKTRILIRIRRVSLGNFGDMRSVGEGVSELRVDCGPGYRVYFLRKGETLVVLLGGGDKRTQSRDIQRAIALSKVV